MSFFIKSPLFFHLKHISLSPLSSPSISFPDPQESDFIFLIPIACISKNKCVLLVVRPSAQYQIYYAGIVQDLFQFYYFITRPKIVPMASTQNHHFPASLKPQKTTDPNPERLPESLEKRSSTNSTSSICSSNDVTNGQHCFRPFVECKSLAELQEGESWAITDRYIPSRKLLKRDSLMHSEDSEEQVENGKEQNSSISDIYRRFIMEGGRSRSKPIAAFENGNILRYSLKTLPLPSETSLLSKNSSLDFAEEVSLSSKKRRKINKLPCKVLDAPALQDDYYLNLIDWSTQNFLAVGLASSVYLWNAANSKVTKLCDLGISDSATSVCWATKGPHFSLGTNSGEVQIWDVNKMKRVRVLQGHTNRVGAISWNSALLSTGSRDKTILHRDLRAGSPFVSKLVGHRQEICGLKWSFDEQQLCSGGNDNKLLVWNSHSSEPILKFNDHVAAVKAMAWSPHQHGLLVSGGGTADRTIRFRNTLTGTTLKTVDVGSQVCNLMFSKTLNEIVSTHGYSHNEINIWRYPQMEKIATLTGHTYRVLYLAMSPDGSTIVTGAGDETLRFWNIFPSRNEEGKKVSSFLSAEHAALR